jgi:hypothetical protein
MGMSSKFTAVAFFVAALTAVPCAALAEETGWLSGYKAYARYKQLERQGYMPVKMLCRDSYKRQLDVGETEYNISFAKNSAGTEYLWAVGSDYGMYKLKADKGGYRQVSFKQYTRKKSGLIIRCAIWHK